jgi:hypothetical protein
MAGAFILVAVLWVAVWGGAGYLIGRGKGRAVAGFWLGAIFGGVGLIVIAVMAPTPQSAAEYQAQVQNALRTPGYRSPTPRRTASRTLGPVPKPRQIDAQGRPAAPTPPAPPAFALGENQPRCSSCGETMPDHWKFKRCPTCVLAG